MQWTEMPEGGHFAALEQPELLVADVIKFADLAQTKGWI
jgi:microsomal epoxide hydrolase